MSKGKIIADKALQSDKKQGASPGVKASRPAKEGERQPTLIHWFLENPVDDEHEQAPPPETPEQAPPPETPANELQAQITRLQMEKQELEAQITQLQTEKHEFSEYRSSILLNKERENKQLKRQVTDLEAQVLRLSRFLDQKDREIETLTANLKEQDAFIAALQQVNFFQRVFQWDRYFETRQ
jgi:predicted RNase H-like nuclease (RuvC/YqgF family)